mmetsp:Transcript_28181/g.65027  ORF Transcript_28181/g.65027 Transcript_28181/m.65027 type:complete len:210 (+) Transcript_28181:1862-2491(+)
MTCEVSTQGSESSIGNWMQPVISSQNSRYHRSARSVTSVMVLPRSSRYGKKCESSCHCFSATISSLLRSPPRLKKPPLVESAVRQSAYTVMRMSCSCEADGATVRVSTCRSTEGLLRLPSSSGPLASEARFQSAATLRSWISIARIVVCFFLVARRIVSVSLFWSWCWTSLYMCCRRRGARTASALRISCPKDLIIATNSVSASFSCAW